MFMMSLTSGGGLLRPWSLFGLTSSGGGEKVETGGGLIIGRGGHTGVVTAEVVDPDTGM